MGWDCSVDNTPLELVGDRLVCPVCKSEAPLASGVPDFRVASEDQGSSPCKSLTELQSLLEEHGEEEAARRFCETHDLTRPRFSADWKLLLAFPQGGTVVEFGGGFGDDTMRLRERGAITHTLVATAQGAALLRSRLDASGATDALVAAGTDPARIPLATGSAHSIAIADLESAGLELTIRSLPEAAKEWARVIAPGGALLVGVPGTLYRAFGLAWLLSILKSSSRDTLDGKLLADQVASRKTRLRAGQLRRALTNAGFEAPKVHAPIPDRTSIDAILPLDDPSVVSYFLNNLVRKNKFTVRIALRVADKLSRLGLLPLFVPFTYLVFERADQTPGGEAS